MILSTIKFNKQQDTEYKEYCNACKGNNIEPTKQERYFSKLSVNYGYVFKNNFGEIFWKKRKQDFNI
jgi:hypothetical protein